MISKYEILTPTGFQEFETLKRYKHSSYVKLILDDGEFICSKDHKFVHEGEIILAQSIEPGFIINDIIVWDVEHIDESIELYDLVNVSGGHVYYTDKFLSHNCDCDFLTSGHTYIDSETLQWYHKEEIVDPVEKRGESQDYWIWEYVNYTNQYIISVDVARGDGSDDSAIEVINADTLTQVAEYIGKVSPRILGRMAVQIATEYNNGLLVIDNRNIGWDTVQEVVDLKYDNLYYSYKDEMYVDPARHISKGYDLKRKADMVAGFTTTSRNRPMMLSKMERMFRLKEIKIRSKRTYNQLMVFVWLNGKPQARPGRKDDAVMSLAMSVYVIETALKLKNIGIEMTKKALDHISKKIYTPKRTMNNHWSMSDGKGGVISTKWLL